MNLKCFWKICLEKEKGKFFLFSPPLFSARADAPARLGLPWCPTPAQPSTGRPPPPFSSFPAQPRASPAPRQPSAAATTAAPPFPLQSLTARARTSVLPPSSHNRSPGQAAAATVAPLHAHRGSAPLPAPRPLFKQSRTPARPPLAPLSIFSLSLTPRSP